MGAMEVQSWVATGMPCTSKPDSSSSASPPIPSSSYQTSSGSESLSTPTTTTTFQDTSFSCTTDEGITNSSSVSFRCITSLKSPAPQIGCLAVHNKILYSASMNEITAFDLTNFVRIDTFGCKIPGSGLVKSIAFGKGKIFTAHQDCKIRVWRLTPSNQHRLVSTLPTLKDRLRHFVLPKNYVQVRRHKRHLWVEHADTVSGLVVTSEGFLYSVSWDKSLKIWKTSDLRCLESVRAHEDAVNAVAVSSDGTVYTASADGRIKVWARDNNRVRSHALRTTLEKHKSTVNALALNPDGSVLFSGGRDHEILVWEREMISSSSTEAHHMLIKWPLIGHTGPVLCLIYAHDLLFSGSADHTVRIWQRGSVEGGGYRCLAVLEGHLRPVKSVAVVEVSGGVSVCSASLDGEIRIWKITIPSLNFSF